MSVKRDIFNSQINQLSNSITSKAGITGRKHISELKPIVDNLNVPRLMTSTELCEVLCTAFNNIPDAALTASAIVTDGIAYKDAMITRDGLWGGTKNITKDGLAEMWQAQIDNVDELFDHYTVCAESGYSYDIFDIMNQFVIQECKTRGFIPPDNAFEVILGNGIYFPEVMDSQQIYGELAVAVKYPLANIQNPYHIFGLVFHEPYANFSSWFAFPAEVTTSSVLDFVDTGVYGVTIISTPTSPSDFDYSTGYSFSLSESDFNTLVSMPTQE